MRTRRSYILGMILCGSLGAGWWLARDAAFDAFSLSEPAVDGDIVATAMDFSTVKRLSGGTSTAPESLAPPTAIGDGIVSEWAGPAPISLVRLGNELLGQAMPSNLRLPVRLSETRFAEMRVVEYTATDPDGGVFTGTLVDVPGSTVVLSYLGASQAGVVLIPAERRAYNFRAGDDGLLRVTELDTQNAPDCGAGDPLFNPAI